MSPIKTLISLDLCINIEKKVIRIGYRDIFLFAYQFKLYIDITYILM